MDKTEKLAEHLGQLLITQQLFLVTAESCTGGGLAEIITRIPGSSHWFERGFVTYSNESKHELLDVSNVIFSEFGAVSMECAEAMAMGAITQSHADVSIAITGIAGPEGGSEKKPVGTVFFAWQIKQQEIVLKREVFKGDRNQIRIRACEFALKKIIKLLTQ